MVNLNIKVSYGTASVLGLVNFKPLFQQKTAYFMIGEKCVFNCAFCAQANGSASSKLSRIEWPSFTSEELLKKMKNSGYGFERICLQTVSSPNYSNLVLEELFEFKGLNIPISVCVRANSLDEVGTYFEAGAQNVGLAIDVPTKELYLKYKGNDYEKRISLLFESQKKYKRITTHLIIGLGETEKEAVIFIADMFEKGIKVGLFAFTPIKATLLKNRPFPDIISYRRIQTAYYLIKNSLISVNDMVFDEKGVILSFGIIPDKIPEPENAFLTSGCSGCTRPYYNDKPGDLKYNFHDIDLINFDLKEIFQR